MREHIEISRLNAIHEELNQLLQETEESDLMRSPEGKWNSLEHVVHLSKALSALHKGLSRPRFLLRYSFGKPNRALRDYEQTKAKYFEKLAQVPEGVTSPFVPKEGEKLSKSEVLQRFIGNQAKLSRVVGKWKDKQLDGYLVPHPLMGKLMVREMLHFMHFHTEHHLDAIRKISRP